MKHVLLSSLARLAFFTTTLLTFQSITAHAQIGSAPVPDGTVRTNEYGTANQITSGGVTWYMNYDATNVYLAIVNAPTTDPVVLYFDINPATPVNTTDGRNGITSGLDIPSMQLPFSADLATHIGSTSSIQDSYTRVAIVNNRNNPSWGPGSRSITVASNGNIREIVIPWSNFTANNPTNSAPTSFNWLGYVAQPNGTPYSAVPEANGISTAKAPTYFTVSDRTVTHPFDQRSYSATSLDAAIPSGAYFDYTINDTKNFSLNGDLAIANQFYISNSILTTGNFTLFLNPAATLIEGTDIADGYVLGKVQASALLNASNTGGYDFSNIGFTVLLENSGGAATYPGFTTVLRTTGQFVTGPTGAKSFTRQYFVNPTTTATGLNVSLRFHYVDGEDNGIPQGRLSLFQAPLPAGYPPTVTLPTNFSERGREPQGSNAGANIVALSNVQLRGVWTLGAPNQPLPVELMSFAGTSQAGGVLLAWATASEKNNRGFTLERQAGTAWQALTFVAGQSSAGAHYQYLDRTAGAGTHYYRLRQQDQDGTLAYSPVVAVLVEGAPAVALALSPVPTADVLTIGGLGSAGAYVAEVYDLRGQRVLTQAFAAAQTQLSVQALPAGVYLVRVQGQGQALLQSKFVKQ